MDFSSFQNHELIALSKALHFIKLRSRGNQAYEIAASPIVADIYMKVAEELWRKTADSKSSSYFISNGWPSINEDSEGIDTIKYHIVHVENWNSLSKDVHIEFIKNIVYPLKVSDAFIDEMISYGNDYHHK